jgi:hypothetical protein
MLKSGPAHREGKEPADIETLGSDAGAESLDKRIIRYDAGDAERRCALVAAVRGERSVPARGQS